LFISAKLNPAYKVNVKINVNPDVGPDAADAFDFAPR
jgi:hypothetical protein